MVNKKNMFGVFPISFIKGMCSLNYIHYDGNNLHLLLEKESDGERVDIVFDSIEAYRFREEDLILYNDNFFLQNSEKRNNIHDSDNWSSFWYSNDPNTIKSVLFGQDTLDDCTKFNHFIVLNTITDSVIDVITGKENTIVINGKKYIFKDGEIKEENIDDEKYKEDN